MTDRSTARTGWHRIVAVVAACGLGAMAGCTTEADGASVHGAEQALTVTAANPIPAVKHDLISASRCRREDGELFGCVIPIATLTPPAVPVTAVPVRTTVERALQGDCRTFHALSVDLDGGDGEVSKLSYLAQASVKLRRKDGVPFTSLTIRDGYAATRLATFPESCAISLSVRWNEPDVDSALEAEGRWARLQAVVAEAETSRARAAELLYTAQAFRLLDGVVRLFHAELTNPVLLELRDAAREGSASLSNLVLSAGATLSVEQRRRLLKLYSTLAVVADGSGPWVRPDGSPKTLADFVGDDGAATIELARSLRDSSPTTRYEEELRKADEAVARAKSARDVGRVQLAPWLGAPSAGALDPLPR